MIEGSVVHKSEFSGDAFASWYQHSYEGSTSKQVSVAYIVCVITVFNVLNIACYSEKLNFFLSNLESERFLYIKAILC